MKISNNKKRKINDMVEQATQACAMGRFDICEQICHRIESIYPNHANVANLRGIMCSLSGQPDAAIQWLGKAIEAAPNKGEFHVNLGKVYLDRGYFEEAARCYQRAIELGKKTLPVQLGYCKALVEPGRYEQALPVLKRLHQQHPRDTDVLMGLFMASEPLDLIEEAEGYLRQVLAVDPGHAEAHVKLARLAVQQGRMAEAESEARQALAIRPDSAGAFDTLGYVKTYTDADDPDIAAMTDLYARSAPGSEERLTLCFTLGKVMEQLKRYDRAFEFFAEGNAIRHKRSRYDAASELAHMEKIMAAYTREACAHTSPVDDPTPVFIVGMPRCGSTLVEQILAAHPDVIGRGECNHFVAKALSPLHSDDNPLTPERMAAFTPEQWGEIGRIYLEHLKGTDTAAVRITDKTLTNFRHIGAIHCALPQAKIVHVRRHPLDTCLSIFKHHLQGFLFDYGFSLDELGDYYRMYLNLMQHWREVLPAGAMYELDYEKLIANQEKETRKLLDYCGLPWNAACLQFNQADNIVRTASMAQVRRGIYSDSMAAWKRYDKQLKPLIRILGTKYPKIR